MSCTIPNLLLHCSIAISTPACQGGQACNVPSTLFGKRSSVQAQRQAEEEERQRQADLEAGRVAKADKLLDLDEEPEEAPTLEFTIPEHKVKLIIGAGGERIKQIQRKSSTRIQVRAALGVDHAVQRCDHHLDMWHG